MFPYIREIMKHTWLIDSGHGGSDGEGYITAPNKMYEHSPTEIFCEGVFNREIKDKLMDELWRNDVRTIDLCPTELDLPLGVRSDIANVYEREYHNCIGISLHSNAGGGTGFEIHTGPGETRSDRYAKICGKILKEHFPMIRYRMGDHPGEWDKDSPFWILKHTHCPWILPECLFFDNYKDYKLLIDPIFQTRYVRALVAFILQVEKQDI